MTVSCGGVVVSILYRSKQKLPTAYRGWIDLDQNSKATVNVSFQAKPKGYRENFISSQTERLP